MAWSTPSSLSTGTLVTAATWNQDVKDNAIALRAGSIALASQAIGDLTYASSTTQLARVAAVAAGQVLASAGTGTVPAWSSTLVISGAGPHVIGGSTLGRTRLLLDGSFTSDGSGNTMEALRSQGVITGASGDTAHLAGAWFANSITTQAVSETITTVAQVIIDEPSITVGSGATITNSASLYIKAAATEATNDYALWIDSGVTRLDGNVGIGTVPGKRLDVSTSTTGDGLRSINTNGSGGIGAIFIETSLTSPSTVRNWGLFNNLSAAGSFNIRSSNAAGGDAYAAGTTWFTITSAGTVDIIAGDLSLAPTQKIYLDGRSNTYIRESAADVIQFVTGAADGVWVGSGGLYIGAYNGDNHFTDASAGGGSATLYIGNQSITTSSDRRLKANIVDSSLNAVEALNRLRVTDYNWNDPSDTSFNNRNARGLWTGLIAQEVVEHLPFAVNAPRDEEKVIDHGSDSTWSIESIALCGVLIKAVQELSARIEGLES